MSKAKKPEKDKNSGVFVYVGPSVRGVIQCGAIFRGTRDEVTEKLSEAIERYPEIEKLIVKDCDITKTKEKLKSGISSLSIAYSKLAK